MVFCGSIWESWVSPRWDGRLLLGLVHGQGLTAWGCTSVLVSLFPSVHSRVIGPAGAKGIGATPLSWPCHLPSVHRDEYSEMVVSALRQLSLPSKCAQGSTLWQWWSPPWIQPSSSWVCARTHTLMVAVSTLELVSLPPEFVHQSTGWQWLPPPWWEAGPGSELPLFPPSVSFQVGSGRLRLSGEKRQSKRAETAAGCRLAGTLRQAWQAG